jgi:predicted phosphodiesterase
MHKQVARITKATKMAVNWVTPAEYDESVSVDFYGTRIGLVHGNQFAPGQAVAWWQKQSFGAQAVTSADVLVHGHYHSFSASVAGRNPVSGKQRYCLGAPTLDNGSDWFRQTQGRDSDPGLMVFDITDNGFDLSSLTILSA